MKLIKSIPHYTKPTFLFSYSKTPELAIPTKPICSPLRFKGLKYEEFYAGNSYKIKAVLNQMFLQNQEEGFFLAYERMLEAMANQDQTFLHSIMHPRLGQAVSSSFSNDLELVRCPKLCQDIVFTEMNIHLGDYHPERKRSCIKLELFEVINLNIWHNGNNEKVIIDSATLSLECYILSPFSLLRKSEEADESVESTYHRVIFETKMVEELRRPLDVFSLVGMSKKKRSKMLSRFFLGKEYEWKVKELDQ